jgi:hypothetical protein
VKKGEQKDNILIQEFGNMNGSFTGNQIVGTLGGALTQIALVLQVA